VPTAVQAVAEVQDTPSRLLEMLPALGLGTTDQLVPFQDSISVWYGLPPVLPVAVQVVAEVQDTPERVSPVLAGLGLGTTDQLVPFQDSARVRPGLVLEA
jgi:hypothetical protein